MNRIYCELCGLPIEYCVCDELKKLPNMMTSPIIVAGKIKGNKTLVTFTTPKSHRQLKKLLPLLRHRLNCGATCRGNNIIINGNQKSAEVLKLFRSLPL